MRESAEKRQPSRRRQSEVPEKERADAAECTKRKSFALGNKKGSTEGREYTQRDHPGTARDSGKFESNEKTGAKDLNGRGVEKARTTLNNNLILKGGCRRPEKVTEELVARDPTAKKKRSA